MASPIASTPNPVGVRPTQKPVQSGARAELLRLLLYHVLAGLHGEAARRRFGGLLPYGRDGD